MLDEGPDEFFECAGSLLVQRAASNRLRAMANSLRVEMPGFWFRIDSSITFVIELESSKARLTLSSGLILAKRRFSPSDGASLYLATMSIPLRLG